jgi:ABC-2 type transport system permease protein
MPRSIFRPRLPRAQAVLALMRRDYAILRSYRLALVLDGFFTVIELATFFFISRTFAEATPADLQGAPTYFAFAFVGIAITAVVAAASSGLADRLREEQLTGTLESVVAQPVASTELALGLAGFPFFFAIVRVVVYLVVAALLFDFDIGRADWVGFFVLLLAAGATMGSLGILIGAAVMVVKHGRSLIGFVSFGMGLLSGAFFPISVLPGWLQPLGRVMPTRFAYDGVRAALYRGEGWGHAALVLIAFSAIAVPLALVVFAGALSAVRRMGSLSQY